MVGADLFGESAGPGLQGDTQCCLRVVMVMLALLQML